MNELQNQIENAKDIIGDNEVFQYNFKHIKNNFQDYILNMKDMLKKDNKNSNEFIIKILGGFIKQQPQEFQDMIMK